MNVLDLITDNSPHLSWIKDRTIYMCLHGSKAFNCNIESSDDDYKGITIPPKEYIFGYSNCFEQAILTKPNPDTTVYDLRKFFKLATTNNPTILETMFVRPEHQLMVSKLGEKLIDNRDLFLSKRVRWTFAGFANSAIKRVKLHRQYLLNPQKKKPERKDFNLPEIFEIKQSVMQAIQAEINKLIAKFNFNFLHDLAPDERIALSSQVEEMLVELKITKDEMYELYGKKLGFDDKIINILQKEREFASSIESWRKYQDWLKNRNPDRAANEAKFGYDTKWGYHIVRLYRTCEELLETGKVNVWREDAEELKEIRKGSWDFDKLIDFSEKSDLKIQNLYNTSQVLPHHPPINKLNNLCQQLIEESFQ